MQAHIRSTCGRGTRPAARLGSSRCGRDAAARPASALPLWRPARARATVDFVLTPRFTFPVTLYAGPSPETPGTAAGVGPSDAAPPPASCATSLLVRC